MFERSKQDSERVVVATLSESGIRIQDHDASRSRAGHGYVRICLQFMSFRRQTFYRNQVLLITSSTDLCADTEKDC